MPPDLPLFFLLLRKGVRSFQSHPGPVLPSLGGLVVRDQPHTGHVFDSMLKRVLPGDQGCVVRKKSHHILLT